MTKLTAAQEAVRAYNTWNASDDNWHRMAVTCIAYVCETMTASQQGAALSVEEREALEQRVRQIVTIWRKHATEAESEGNRLQHLPVGNELLRDAAQWRSCADTLEREANTPSSQHYCKACGKPWPEYATDTKAHNCEASQQGAALSVEEREALEWCEVFAGAVTGRTMDRIRTLCAALRRITGERVPCPDAGVCCLNCQPRNADGTCPDAAPPTPQGESGEMETIRFGYGGWECCGNYGYNGDCCYRPMQRSKAPPAPQGESGDSAKLRHCVRVIEELVHKLNEVTRVHNDRSCEYDVCKPIRDAHHILADDDYAITSPAIAAGPVVTEAVRLLREYAARVRGSGTLTVLEAATKSAHIEAMSRTLTAIAAGPVVTDEAAPHSQPH